MQAAVAAHSCPVWLTLLAKPVKGIGWRERRRERITRETNPSGGEGEPFCQEKTTKSEAMGILLAGRIARSEVMGRHSLAYYASTRSMHRYDNSVLREHTPDKECLPISELPPSLGSADAGKHTRLNLGHPPRQLATQMIQALYADLPATLTRDVVVARQVTQGGGAVIEVEP